MKQNVNIVCVCVGDKYNKENVNRLYRMVERNCSLPYTFYCISDKQQDVNTIFIKKELDLESYWWKICLFDLDWDLPTLYLDLDVVIQNNFNYVFDKIDDTLMLINNNDVGAYYPYDGCPENIMTIPPTTINSSIMLFRPQKLNYIYKKFVTNSDYFMIHYYGLDRFLQHEFNNLAYFDFNKDFYHRSKGSLPDNKLTINRLNYDPSRTFCILSQSLEEHYKGLEKYFL